MNSPTIPARRLAAQQIAYSSAPLAPATATPSLPDPARVVASLGAVQAQDYTWALWTIGLRAPGSTEADIESAVVERRIVRTWPMRGTLHFVAAEDIRWMLGLLTPRVIAGSAARCRQLELDDAQFGRSRDLCVAALQGGLALTRDDLLVRLEQAGIATASQRGYHILWRLAQEGTLCFSSRSGKQPTFSLLEEWVAPTPPLDRDAALAALAVRYFIGHGPATLQDFVWWTGLKTSDARAGLESARSQLAHETVDGVSYWMSPDGPPVPKLTGRVDLLAAFDEYLLGYRDRSAVITPEHARLVVPGSNGIFLPVVVAEGRVCGTWKRSVKRNKVIVTATPFRALKKNEQTALTKAAERYGQFVGLQAEVTLTDNP